MYKGTTMIELLSRTDKIWTNMSQATLRSHKEGIWLLSTAELHVHVAIIIQLLKDMPLLLNRTKNYTFSSPSRYTISTCSSLSTALSDARHVHFGKRVTV